MKKMALLTALIFALSLTASAAFAMDQAVVSPIQAIDGGIGQVLCLAFSQDGTFLAAGGSDGKVLIYNMKTKEPARTIDAHKGAVNCLAFDPDGRWLASGGKDKTVNLWDLGDGHLRGSYKEHKDPVLSIAVNSDGSLIASGGGDKKIVVWNTDSQMVYGTLTGHDKAVHSLAFHPDGNSILSSGRDRNIISWSVAQRSELRRLTEPAAQFGSTTRTVFGPDGVLFATALKEVRSAIEGNRRSQGGIKEIDQVQVRNNLTGESAARLEGHLETINDIAFSPDGRYIISASDDRSVRLWNIETASQLTELQVPDKALSVAASPTGRFIASGLSSGKIMLWSCTNIYTSPVYVAHNRGYKPNLDYLPEYKGAPVRIAIIGIEADDKCLDRHAADILADILQNALVKTGRFELLERRNIQKVLDEQALQLNDLCDSKSAVKIGNLLGAKETVTGKIGKVGNHLTVEISFIDVETSKVKRTAEEHCDCSDDDLFLLIESVANHAAKQVK